MKRFKKWRRSGNNDEISYWESMTDLMSALILIVLLIFALVLLYIVRIPDFDYKDLYEGDSYADYDASDHIHDYDHEDRDDDGADDDENDFDDYEHFTSGGGGGGGGYHDYDHEYDYEYEYPGIVNGTGKTAVHVTVVDAETEKAIAFSGTEFQLFRPGSILQVLNTYYPVKTEYTKYLTTEKGEFFLPEKIPGGSYYFHELTAPTGYDASEDFEFIAVEDHDWGEPLEIKIGLYPSRNQIQIDMTDSLDGSVVEGAEFDVIALEDIITYDGTKRFSKGQTVDRIVVDDQGHGESAELYLGKYELSEVKTPLYYAKESENPEVEIAKKGTAEDKKKDIRAVKTNVTYQVLDELDKSMPVSGTVFKVQEQGGTVSKIYKSDEVGQIYLTDLQKNTTYQVKQVSAENGYIVDPAEYSFKVSADGTVDGEASTSIDVYNRLIRLKVGIRAKILKNLVSDYSVAMYNDRDELVERWDSTGVSKEISGIEPGTYRCILRGDTSKPIILEVEDTCEEQEFYVDVMTTSDVAIIGIAIAAVILILVLLVVFVSRKRNDKRG